MMLLLLETYKNGMAKILELNTNGVKASVVPILQLKDIINDEFIMAEYGLRSNFSIENDKIVCSTCLCNTEEDGELMSEHLVFSKEVLWLLLAATISVNGKLVNNGYETGINSVGLDNTKTKLLINGNSFSLADAHTSIVIEYPDFDTLANFFERYRAEGACLEPPKLRLRYRLSKFKKSIDSEVIPKNMLFNEKIWGSLFARTYSFYLGMLKGMEQANKEIEETFSFTPRLFSETPLLPDIHDVGVEKGKQLYISQETTSECRLLPHYKILKRHLLVLDCYKMITN